MNFVSQILKETVVVCTLLLYPDPFPNYKWNIGLRKKTTSHLYGFMVKPQ